MNFQSKLPEFSSRWILQWRRTLKALREGGCCACSIPTGIAWSCFRPLFFRQACYDDISNDFKTDPAMGRIRNGIPIVANVGTSPFSAVKLPSTSITQFFLSRYVPYSELWQNIFISINIYNTSEMQIVGGIGDVCADFRSLREAY